MDSITPLLYSGIGSSSKAGEAAIKINIHKALIVTDTILLDIGIVNTVIQSLQDKGIEYILYDGVLPDPEDKQVSLLIQYSFYLLQRYLGT